MEGFLNEYVSTLFNEFLNPKKRVFWGYLLCSFSLVFLWGLWAGHTFSMKKLLRRSTNLFSRRIWWSISARADYKIFLINQTLLLLIQPLLLTRIAVTTFFFYYFSHIFDSPEAFFVDFPRWFASICYTIFLFLLDDLSRYLLHRALHRIPILWAFHEIHHSAETLTPLTIFRTHPIEAIFFTFRSILVQAFTVSSFIFMFGDAIDLITIYGVNVFLFIFNITGANLRHFHLRITYGYFWEHIFISPAQHQIHHSSAPQHYDSNYGVVLAIWDWLWGTLYIIEKKENYSVGVFKNHGTQKHQMCSIYFGPFLELYQNFKNKPELSYKQTENDHVITE